MRISIRRATLSDAMSVAAVEVITWQSAYRHLMPDAFLDGLSLEDKTTSWHLNLLKHQHGERKRTLVAVRHEEVIGFATVGRMQEEANLGLLYLTYVLPKHWRSGVGKTLLDAVMDEFRDLEVREAILWVLQDNGRARRFYESQGWHADGRTQTDDYGGVELEALRYRRAVV